MASRLKRICYRRGIPLAASCRPTPSQQPVPPPEGRSLLMHLANVAVYLRTSKRGMVSAHLVEHPERAKVGRRIEFVCGKGFALGRITKDSMRVRLQEKMVQLRKKYRGALKDDALQGPSTSSGTRGRVNRGR